MSNCSLHLECDGNHKPKVRIEGDICGRGNRGLIFAYGPVDAKYWLTLASGPRLKGVCVTISY